MRYKFFIIFAFMLLFGVMPLSAQKYSVTVEVDNIETLNGDIFIAAFKDGTMKFLDKHRVDGAVIPPKIGSVRAVFSLPAAKYVFVSFQDENGNMELDTNWIGYPAEPYAISNNLMIPRYKAAEVDVKGDTTIKLKF